MLLVIMEDHASTVASAMKWQRAKRGEECE